MGDLDGDPGFTVGPIDGALVVGALDGNPGVTVGLEVGLWVGIGVGL